MKVITLTQSSSVHIAGNLEWLESSHLRSRYVFTVFALIAVSCLIVEPLVARKVGEDVVQDLELALRKDLVETLAYCDHDNQLQ